MYTDINNMNFSGETPFYHNLSDGPENLDNALLLRIIWDHMQTNQMLLCRYNGLLQNDQWVRTCMMAVLISIRGNGENLSQYCSKFMSSISNIRTHLFMFTRLNQPKNLTMYWQSSLRSISVFIICIWGNTLCEHKHQFQKVHSFMCVKTTVSIYKKNNNTDHFDTYSKKPKVTLQLWLTKTT